MNQPLPEFPMPRARADAPTILGAPPASMRGRHWGATLAFLLLAVLPTLLAAGYLYTSAADQYASRAAFAVRSNDTSAPLEIFGAVTQLGTSSAATDGQVLYDFIRSQQLVEAVDAKLDLRVLFNRAPRDWVFSLGPDRPIEDLVEHWGRMTDIALDPSSGILTLEIRAFAAEDARLIARAVLAESALLVNRLAETARRDAVAHAASERTEAEERLRAIRLDLRRFRDREQEVDPAQNARVAIELLAGLEEKLSAARVELESLNGVLDDTAPRMRILRRRIASLETRIAAERTRLGTGRAEGAGDAQALSRVVGDFEELVVDRDLAQEGYTLALKAYETAQAEARRRHRYLTAHIEPTLSEEAEYPRREILIGAVFLLGLLLWSILVLFVWNLRERR